ncbi:uncharacterized protein BKCO1_35000125 [Diplodia corticola]|uniref:Uncharacterized protein n=1 Tax=Diplodia corticola TaxID=236234 RepID=A0A1J9QVA4_9PEZI|nr:uncharacterized protein BKCO1_35000125 [Diplodia corticola]OJD32926.1 hypothetical protein BKCO1_35000125 [Diplodia corticola]
MASFCSHFTTTAQHIWSLIKWKPRALTELYEREADPRARFLAYTVLYPLMAYSCAVLTFIDATSLYKGPPPTIRISVNGVEQESYAFYKADDAAPGKYARFAHVARQPIPNWLMPPPDMFYVVFFFFQLLHSWEYPLGRHRSHRLRSPYQWAVQVASGAVVQQFLMARNHGWRTLICVVVPWKMLLGSILEEPAEAENVGSTDPSQKSLQERERSPDDVWI